MFLCPKILLTVYKSVPLAKLKVAKVCLAVWNVISLSIPAIIAQSFKALKIVAILGKLKILSDFSGIILLFCKYNNLAAVLDNGI